MDNVKGINGIVMKLMEDGSTMEDALDELRSMRRRINNGEDPIDVLYELGLDPGYISFLVP